jgi:arylformamidase
MPIDYEAEYDNRARVPEHPQIFARWARDAEDYRAQAMQERRAELGLSYGESPRQFIDLFSAGARWTRAPLALFIHGGYWRSLEPSLFSHMARGLNARGVSVAVVGYDLCPQVTIADIIEQIRHACLFLWLRTGQHLLVYGHSAGGHLAGAMAATDWPTLYPKAGNLVPAAYSISGVFDLTPLVGVAVNQDLRLTEQSAREASPLDWPAPKGRVFDAVVGGLESSEFLRQSRVVAETWSKGGAQTRFEAIAGTNHFTVVDALADPESAMVGRLAELAGKVR